MILSPHAVDNRTVREAERASIRAFLEHQGEYITGDVLDYGCGQQPYRELIMRTARDYTGYDRVRFPANVSGRDTGELHDEGYDAIVCTQIAQYWPDPKRALQYMASLLVYGGHLVMTYPTTWAEVEQADLWRYTAAGMEALLTGAGMEVRVHERRAEINLGGFVLPIGYGVVAERA